MAIKMIVTDLDGTLLNTQNTISEKNKAAFKKAKEKGIIRVVATGRIDKEGWFAAEAIGGTDYMLSGNGGVVRDYKKDIVIFEDALSKEIIRQIIELVAFLSRRIPFMDVSVQKKHFLKCQQQDGPMNMYVNLRNTKLWLRISRTI